MRQPNSGSRCIQVPESDSVYWMRHSRQKDSLELHDVVTATSCQTRNVLISWDLQWHDSGVLLSMWPSLQSTPLPWAYHDGLQDLVNRIPRSDTPLIAGAWNARTEPENEYTHHILGRFRRLGERCEIGDRSVSDLNRLVVTAIRFQYPKRHLLTWYSDDGRTTSWCSLAGCHRSETVRHTAAAYRERPRHGPHSSTRMPQASPFRTTEHPTEPQSPRAQVNNSRQRQSFVKCYHPN